MSEQAGAGAARFEVLTSENWREFLREISDKNPEARMIEGLPVHVRESRFLPAVIAGVVAEGPITRHGVLRIVELVEEREAGR